jgi:hypothetical protein
MTRTDKDALARAIEMAKTLDPVYSAAVESKLTSGAWEEAALYACVHLQSQALRLRPWMCPPCHANDAIDLAEGDHYGNKPGEVALRQRMIALGLSVYEPNPLEAIERAERAKDEAPLPAA